MAPHPTAFHHDAEDDPRHDLGLLHDLGTLGIDPAPRALGRRRALQVLAGGAGALALAACGKGGSSSSAATSTTSTSGAAASSSTSASGATSTTAASGSSAGGTRVTDEIPSETGGPYPGDGSNGPNVLSDSGIVREDIRSSFGSASGTAAGVPLDVMLKLVHAGTGAPLGGAAVYLWHCDREGRYSLYSDGATDQNYCRGVQAADSNGRLAFTSTFPAAYSGRYPHIHFEIFQDLATATSAGSKLKTTQLALPAAACDIVYASSGYGQSKANFAQTPISRDMVFSDGYSLQMATVTGDVAGMTATLTVAV